MAFVVFPLIAATNYAEGKSIKENPFRLEASIERGIPILKDMCSPAKKDRIPPVLLQKCKGIAYIRIYRAGLTIFGVTAGGGFGIVKVEDPSSPTGYVWSDPVSLVCGGLGYGVLLGGEIVDCILIFNTSRIIDAIKSGSKVRLLGNMSVAIGPVGKSSASRGAPGSEEVYAAYSYAK